MCFARSQIGDKLGQHITLQRRHEEPTEKARRDVFKPGKGTASEKAGMAGLFTRGVEQEKGESRNSNKPNPRGRT